jgi:DNA-binding NtrC family response regulator
MTATLLVIDDDRSIRQAMVQFGQRRGFMVTEAGDGRVGVECYERERPDLVVLDLELPGLSGLQVLEILRQRDPEATVLILTGFGDVPTAVQAMQLGAEHFLMKPVEFELLDAAVSRAMERTQLRRRARFFAERDGMAPTGLEDLRRHAATAPLAEQLELLAAGSAPVLLLGETGTGKGWAARLLHSLSPRAAAPCVEVNCAGLTPSFLDSELFGHEKGAFTDAKNMKRGLFEIADGGTLFLDEIGDLAPELQPKLLKVLETMTFRRLGGTREIRVDVRLIAATNKELAAEVQTGKFREDLYYRLAVLPLRMPSLRERDQDAIVTLAGRFLAELSPARPGHPIHLTPSALAALVRHHWPGNIRELRNVLERAVLLAGAAGEIRPEHLPLELRPISFPVAATCQTPLSLKEAERSHVERVLRLHNHNRARTARALGITRVTLYKKLRAYGLAGGADEGPGLARPGSGLGGPRRAIAAP